MWAVVAVGLLFGCLLLIRTCRAHPAEVDNAPALEEVQAQNEVLAKQLRECEAREDKR